MTASPATRVLAPVALSTPLGPTRTPTSNRTPIPRLFPRPPWADFLVPWILFSLTRLSAPLTSPGLTRLEGCACWGEGFSGFPLPGASGSRAGISPALARCSCHPVLRLRSCPSCGPSTLAVGRRLPRWRSARFRKAQTCWPSRVERWGAGVFLLFGKRGAVFQSGTGRPVPDSPGKGTLWVLAELHNLVKIR